jgi:hypothetical protein
MDFFWGYIEDNVHNKRVESPNLHQRITVAIAAVRVHVLFWVWGEVEFRFSICKAISGTHIELH